LDNVSSIGKVLRNATPLDETGLVFMSKVGDEGLDPGGKNFGRDFDGGILQGDRAVVVCMASLGFFWG